MIFSLFGWKKLVCPQNGRFVPLWHCHYFCAYLLKFIIFQLVRTQVRDKYSTYWWFSFRTPTRWFLSTDRTPSWKASTMCSNQGQVIHRQKFPSGTWKPHQLIAQIKFCFRKLRFVTWSILSHSNLLNGVAILYCIYIWLHYIMLIFVKKNLKIFKMGRDNNCSWKLLRFATWSIFYTVQIYIVEWRCNFVLAVALCHLNIFLENILIVYWKHGKTFFFWLNSIFLEKIMFIEIPRSFHLITCFKLHLFISIQVLMKKLRGLETSEVDFSTEAGGKSSYIRVAKLKSRIIEKFREFSKHTGENYFGKVPDMYKYQG